MFELSQPESTEGPLHFPLDGGRDLASTPVIEVTEDGRTLDSLLRICYPVRPPALDQMWHVEQVLEAATKYQMDWALHSTREALSRIAEEEPISVYAVACRYGLHVETSQAAQFSLSLPVTTVIDSLIHEGVAGEPFRVLMKYRSECQAAALSATETWLWTINMPKQFWTTHSCCTRTTVRDRTGRVYHVQPWWIRYITMVAKALRDTPSEDVVDVREALGLYMSDGRGTCGRCLSVAVDHITAFATKLSEEIAEGIAKIPFPSL
ncbi:hypothetical protein PHLCEN_2v9274 [Hermanssonia centrifuga]|uniref:BTB/POZ domain-containing protein n=1 Tax=Hermanssonia centrifuga TaxID=98765 RepID=A0A2R6NRB6_9APHY|nr:hypothetical protein PHLCEN_2v9274 [Hermanssonia centrifuga]